MATAVQKTITKILDVAKLAQSLAQNDSAVKKILSGGSLDDDLGAKIFIERSIIEDRFSKNPDDPQLRETANFLYSLLGKYATIAENIINGTTAGKPTVTGPSNQSVAIGGTATFTISVTTVLLFTIKWFKNGVEVPGETGTSLVVTPTLSDNGSTFYATVTNLVGSTTSSTATLTVTNTLVGYAFYGPDGSDPYPALAAGTDGLTYQVSQSMVHNQPVSFTMPTAAGNNQYLVFKIPVGEDVFNQYFNTAFIQGNFTNDFSFHDPLIDATLGFTYYVSRQALSIDTTQPFILRKV